MEISEALSRGVNHGYCRRHSCKWGFAGVAAIPLLSSPPALFNTAGDLWVFGEHPFKPAILNGCERKRNAHEKKNLGKNEISVLARSKRYCTLQTFFVVVVVVVVAGIYFFLPCFISLHSCSSGGFVVPPRLCPTFAFFFDMSIPTAFAFWRDDASFQRWLLFTLLQNGVEDVSAFSLSVSPSHWTFRHGPQSFQKAEQLVRGQYFIDTSIRNFHREIHRKVQEFSIDRFYFLNFPE